MKRTTVAVLVMLVLGAACARTPPTAPPLPAAETRLYDDPYPIVWDTVRVDLVNDPRLEVDTIDKNGRFVAWERTNNLFLLLNRRNVITVELEPLGEEKTRLVLQMSAQKYDTGGWSRPAGWYPSARVDEEMGEEIVARIDRRLGHTPSLAETAAADAAPDIAEQPVPAEPAIAPAMGPAEPAPPSRTGWRRWLPPWPFGRSH